MSTLERAIEIAAKAHAGVTDKSGQPYILHPLRVMLAVRTTDERMAAVLHDVVEDTGVTLEDLRSERFPASVIEAIDALTKREGESRMDAARRAADNDVACQVKLADVSDNLDLTRITDPQPHDIERLEEYRVVRGFLLSCARPG